MDGSDIRAAAAASRELLDQGLDRDWSVQIPGMDWTVSTVVGHMARVLIWYSADSSAGAEELSTVDIEVRSEVGPTELARTLTSWATVLAGTLDALPPGTRGWHPFGLADVSGFAGMACDELLIHTDDAARGLGLSFTPPEELVRATLERIFPWTPPGDDPWQELLWANGRIDLPGREHQVRWRWHCAPLSEWDGTKPPLG